MIVLDTNVLSELMRKAPNERVANWVDAIRKADLFVSAASQAEVLFGLAKMAPGRKRSDLVAAADAMFMQDFRGRILPFDLYAAPHYAEIVAARRQAGNPIEAFDAQIAATARHHGMVVATRDKGGFADCGIEVLNPWGAA